MLLYKKYLNWTGETEDLLPLIKLRLLHLFGLAEQYTFHACVSLS